MKVLSFLFICALSFVFAETLLAESLPIPFTPQAPYGVWTQPWQDACEEAAIVMVDHFYRGYASRTIPKPDAAEAIREAYNVKNNLYGWSLDENADKMTRWINDFYGWGARLIEKPTEEEIKTELAAGRPVIAPAHGRSLGNPYFRAGGPDYHTVVISGYDDATREFIVQEPGTRRGLDFRYPYDRLLSAIHDYVPGGKTKTGRQVVIFTNPEIQGTHSTLIKSPARPEVYLLSHGTRRHIANERVFLARGWRWEEIIVVSSQFLSGLREGETINSAFSDAAVGVRTKTSD